MWFFCVVEEDRGKICRFYRTKYGCFQGDRCPNKHIEQGTNWHFNIFQFVHISLKIETYYISDVSGKVFIFGGLSCAPIQLPDIGTWIAVRVTAIYNPGHFWIQMPFGSEPLDAQIMKSKILWYRPSLLSQANDPVELKLLWFGCLLNALTS